MNFLLLRITIGVLTVAVVEGATCGTTEWECSSQEQCIHEADVCDGRPHCADASDETFHFCSQNFKCPEYSFGCAYGACVDGDAACNGIQDCADGSDELLPSCEGVVSVPAQHNCSNWQFACLSGDECVGEELKCDGVADCADASDETITQCSYFPCPEYGFRCAYGGCVDGDAPCDGRPDCADGSDEFAPQCNATGPAATPQPPTQSPTEPPIGRQSACRLPPPPEHGTYTSYTCEPGSQLPQCRAVADTEVGAGFDLHFSCFNGFTLRGNGEQYCRSGGWYPKEVPICSDECEPLVSSRLVLKCFRSNIQPISCQKKMPSNAFARFTCRPATYIKVAEPGYSSLVCKGGQWDRPLTDDFCQPACGRAVLQLAEPVISNGAVVESGQFPWHAGIYQYKNESQTWNLNCGGSLVSHNLVISAAHCFKKELFTERGLMDLDISLMRVVLGKRYRDINSPLDKVSQSFEIKTVISNPDYTASKDNFGDDIALVILSRSVEFTHAVLPVCLDLGQFSSEEDQLVPGAIGMVAGWGLTENMQPSETLLVAHMPYVPRDVCLKSSNIYTYVTKDKLCGGDPAKSKTSVCKGDSGGGYVFEDKKTRSFYLRGVVSLGSEGCQGQDYALFTRIAKHASFINQYI